MKPTSKIIIALLIASFVIWILIVSLVPLQKPRYHQEIDDIWEEVEAQSNNQSDTLVLPGCKKIVLIGNPDITINYANGDSIVYISDTED
ncbi:MAG: hypothetical protein LIP09_13450 [Bacteroidales bacterium]|nr:hypothetical protein [Bacteroidales bacterium]